MVVKNERRNLCDESDELVINAWDRFVQQKKDRLKSRAIGCEGLQTTAGREHRTVA
jgi:hypothetical protein